MTIDAVFKKIDRYLKKENIGPLVVDVQNSEDLDAVVTHYNLPQNEFICASDTRFCKADEFPDMASLMNFLGNETGNYFVQEVSSFFRLKGETELKQMLMEFLSMSSAGHVVIFTYQCNSFLTSIIRNDRRLDNRICVIDGVHADIPKLVFTAKDVNFCKTNAITCGIDKIAKLVESSAKGVIVIETGKNKSNFPSSLYSISEMIDPYEILCSKDSLTTHIPKAFASSEDWKYVLSEFQSYPSWKQLISAKVGNAHSLDIVISNYKNNRSDKRWLWFYFVGLKLFGSASDIYLNAVTKKTNSPEEFIRNLFRTLLDYEPTDQNFAFLYESRKTILNAIGNPIDEIVRYCKIVLSMEEKAIFYLTDNTLQEREMIFRILDKYGLEYDRTTLMETLANIYPSLHEYLLPYRFKNDLLNEYFQEYKYQKVINKIFPEFMEVVENQAVARDYNAILQPRSAVIESIDTLDAQTFFTDAMGVEYLGYIMSKCQSLHLMAKVHVCRSELPSITSRNKDFWDVLSTAQYPIITFNKLDKIKHHGEEGYDYSRADRKLPFHLIRELQLIDDLLENIKIDLASGTYKKAILVADHGASRLAVIHETENLVKMESNGQHSGRCCPKSDVDVKPDNATDADDFWALANYDRFKGSRKANVEVHGGATLEEVVVPIIELTYFAEAVEIRIMPVDATVTFSGTPEILVSFRKKAAIKIFSTQKLMDVSIQIDGHVYDAKAVDNNFYIVESMPEIRRAKTYEVDVYACGNKVASALPLRVKKESGSEKSIL
ncbi:BREX-4 system phosphatase PglZ [uncultured Phascolarctobacterium sp.]|uniref:BREX-4 system phosphatase PglZ n=1 Tax=uncultured Phascolarctobacterium sp. TaxID=512296 RepID=UPI0025D7378F|nr:BREX-4 system phosphatase PglZ [uncultured Phascolarctobacterium sp.]